MYKKWRKEVIRMAVYVGFPVVMFAVFNSAWFYEDAIYQARMAYEKHRDPLASSLMRKSVEIAKQEQLRKKIEERENK